MICQEPRPRMDAAGPTTSRWAASTPPACAPGSRGVEPIPARSLPRILLASKSPRRRELLNSIGVAHEIIESGVDDGQLAPGLVAPEQWVAALAYLKAAAAVSLRAQTLRTVPSLTPELVLGADTVVVDAGEIIGQPRDRADAERILRRLIDGEHSVLTGVALIDAVSGRRDLFVDRAEVAVGPVSDEEIAAYLDSQQWRGKAGAYNLAERLAAGWPIRHKGDPGTIMGLPVRSLLPRLHAFSR